MQKQSEVQDAMRRQNHLAKKLRLYVYNTHANQEASATSSGMSHSCSKAFLHASEARCCTVRNVHLIAQCRLLEPSDPCNQSVPEFPPLSQLYVPSIWHIIYNPDCYND